MEESHAHCTRSIFIRFRRNHPISPRPVCPAPQSRSRALPGLLNGTHGTAGYTRSFVIGILGWCMGPYPMAAAEPLQRRYVLASQYRLRCARPDLGRSTSGIPFKGACLCRRRRHQNLGRSPASERRLGLGTGARSEPAARRALQPTLARPRSRAFAHQTPAPARVRQRTEQPIADKKKPPREAAFFNVFPTINACCTASHGGLCGDPLFSAPPYGRHGSKSLRHA